jgi:hypothetical protein
VDRIAAGEDRRAWRQALRSFDPASAVALKEDGGAAVYRAHLLGRDVVLKRWDLRTLGARLKAVARCAQADRHWRNARWLAGNGFRTSACYVLATNDTRGGPRRWLVMGWLPGRTVLEHLASGEHSVRQDHALAMALGRQLAEFALANALNRDHKPSNLVVLGEPDNPEVAILDCVGIRLRRSDPARMFASLMIEPLGCGLSVRRSLAARAIRAFTDRTFSDALPLGAQERAAVRAFRNDLWRHAAALVSSHGDPRPRVNPLLPSSTRR